MVALGLERQEGFLIFKVQDALCTIIYYICKLKIYSHCQVFFCDLSPFAENHLIKTVQAYKDEIAVFSAKA